MPIGTLAQGRPPGSARQTLVRRPLEQLVRFAPPTAETAVWQHLPPESRHHLGNDDVPTPVWQRPVPDKAAACLGQTRSG